MAFTFETKKNEEMEWLRKVYGKSVDRIRFNAGGMVPSVEQQKREARAYFDTMRRIAGKGRRGVVSSLDELERLCYGNIDGRISDEKFVTGLKSVARKHNLNEHFSNYLKSVKPANGKVKQLDQSNPLLNYHNPALDYYGKKYEVGMGIRNVLLDKAQKKKSTNTGYRNKMLEVRNPLLENVRKTTGSASGNPLLDKVEKKSNKGSYNNKMLSVRNPLLENVKKTTHTNSGNPLLNASNAFLKNRPNSKKAPNLSGWLDAKNPLLGKPNSPKKNSFLTTQNPFLKKEKKGKRMSGATGYEMAIKKMNKIMEGK